MGNVHIVTIIFHVTSFDVCFQSCLTVFKSLSTLEKTVEKCKIKMDLQGSQLVFQLYCKHGEYMSWYTYDTARVRLEKNNTLQMTFSNAFNWMKVVVFWLRFQSSSFKSDFFALTHCGLVMPYSVRHLTQHSGSGNGLLPVAPSHYLNQLWVTISEVQWD